MKKTEFVGRRKLVKGEKKQIHSGQTKYQGNAIMLMRRVIGDEYSNKNSNKNMN
jgi:hypothetical protein